uniref:Uncharacterized protein n=1 Tax=Arundo donax TaxID=35708 RepID=A0A0A9C6G0_ARUDO
MFRAQNSLQKELFRGKM